MKMVAATLLVLACGFFVTPAYAAPPSCAEIQALSVSQSDPERVADQLRTTRARVNACAKLQDTLERLVERREQVHLDRRDRGLER